MSGTIGLLVLVVFLAFLVEAALGFGATVVAVALGAFLVPIPELLAAFVPLNIVLSAYLAVRYRRDIHWRLLMLRIVPLMVAGIPVGLLLLGWGVVHGAFATGGPMAVFVSGRVLTDKGRFRSTLSTL